MTNIECFCPFFYEESRDGYEEGKSPEEIVKNSSRNIEVTTEEQKKQTVF